MDKLIVQGIVSGLMLAVVLCLRLIDNDKTVSAREGLREMLIGNTSITELTEGVQDLAGYLWRAEPPAQVNEVQAQPALEPNAESPVQDVQSMEDLPAGGRTAETFEMKPNETLADTEPQMTGEASKSTAPEPPALTEP